MYDFPIKFKHFTLEEGNSVPAKADERALKGYVLRDPKGIVFASSTNLASLIEYAAKCDGDFELAQQFIERKLGAEDYLDDVDIDKATQVLGDAGLMLPGNRGPRLN